MHLCGFLFHFENQSQSKSPFILEAFPSRSKPPTKPSPQGISRSREQRGKREREKWRLLGFTQAKRVKKRRDKERKAESIPKGGEGRGGGNGERVRGKGRDVGGEKKTDHPSFHPSSKQPCSCVCVEIVGCGSSQSLSQRGKRAPRAKAVKVPFSFPLRSRPHKHKSVKKGKEVGKIGGGFCLPRRARAKDGRRGMGWGREGWSRVRTIGRKKAEIG